MSVSCWTACPAVIVDVMRFWVVFLLLYISLPWGVKVVTISTYHEEVFYKVSSEIKDCHSQHLRIWEWHFGGLDVFLMEDGWAAALQAISFLPSLLEGRGCPLPGPARTVFCHLQRVGGLLSLSCCSDPCCWTLCQKCDLCQMAVGLPLLRRERNVMIYK